MKTIKIYSTTTETYFINPNHITFFYFKTIESFTIIRLSCGKEIQTHLTVTDIQKLITEQ